MKAATLFVCFMVCYRPNMNNAKSIRNQKLSFETIQRMMLTWAHQCAMEVNVPFYEWELVFFYLMTNEDLPRDNKCLLACMSKKMGIQSADGKYNKKGVVAALKQMDSIYQNNEKVKEIKKDTVTCLSQVTGGNDQCDTASEVVKCIKMPDLKKELNFRKKYSDSISEAAVLEEFL